MARDKGDPEKQRLTLEGMAQGFQLPSNWPTPMSRDHRSGEAVKSDAELWGTKGRPLERVAATWRTPTASDSGEKASPATHQLMLCNQVRDFLPPSFPDQATLAGETSSIAGHNLPPPSPKRRLNPLFVEALMRWPTGLSGFVRAETAWTQWWALMPTYVLALCSPSTTDSERQGSLL